MPFDLLQTLTGQPSQQTKTQQQIQQVAAQQAASYQQNQQGFVQQQQRIQQPNVIRMGQNLYPAQPTGLQPADQAQIQQSTQVSNAISSVDTLAKQAADQAAAKKQSDFQTAVIAQIKSDFNDSVAQYLDSNTVSQINSSYFNRGIIPTSSEIEQAYLNNNNFILASDATGTIYYKPGGSLVFHDNGNNGSYYTLEYPPTIKNPIYTPINTSLYDMGTPRFRINDPKSYDPNFVAKEQTWISSGSGSNRTQYKTTASYADVYLPTAAGSYSPLRLWDKNVPQISEEVASRYYSDITTPNNSNFSKTVVDPNNLNSVYLSLTGQPAPYVPEGQSSDAIFSQLLYNGKPLTAATATQLALQLHPTLKSIETQSQIPQLATKTPLTSGQIDYINQYLKQQSTQPALQPAQPKNQLSPSLYGSIQPNPYSSGTQDWWNYELNARQQAGETNTAKNPVSPFATGYKNYYESPIEYVYSDKPNPYVVGSDQWWTYETGQRQLQAEQNVLKPVYQQTFADQLSSKYNLNLTPKQKSYINIAYDYGSSAANQFFAQQSQQQQQKNQPTINGLPLVSSNLITQPLYNILNNVSELYKKDVEIPFTGYLQSNLVTSKLGKEVNDILNPNNYNPVESSLASSAIGSTLGLPFGLYTDINNPLLPNTPQKLASAAEALTSVPSSSIDLLSMLPSGLEILGKSVLSNPQLAAPLLGSLVTSGLSSQYEGIKKSITEDPTRFAFQQLGTYALLSGLQDSISSGYGYARTIGQTPIPLKQIGIPPEYGYPLGIQTPETLKESFATGKLIPEPFTYARSQVTNRPSIVESARLPTNIDKEPYVLWTAWERPPSLLDTGFKGKFTIPELNSEIKGMYGAPIAETYFSKVLPTENYNLLDFSLGLKRPAIIQTPIKTLETVPTELSQEAISNGKIGYTKISNYLQNMVNKPSTTAYLPMTKAEYEAVIPAGTNVNVGKTGYYTNIGGLRVPIYRFNPIEGVTEDVLKSSGKNILPKSYYSEYQPSGLINAYDLLFSTTLPALTSTSAAKSRSLISKEVSKYTVLEPSVYTTPSEPASSLQERSSGKSTSSSNKPSYYTNPILDYSYYPVVPSSFYGISVSPTQYQSQYNQSQYKQSQYNYKQPQYQQQSSQNYNYYKPNTIKTSIITKSDLIPKPVISALKSTIKKKKNGRTTKFRTINPLHWEYGFGAEPSEAISFAFGGLVDKAFKEPTRIKNLKSKNQLRNKTENITPVYKSVFEQQPKKSNKKQSKKGKNKTKVINKKKNDLDIIKSGLV